MKIRDRIKQHNMSPSTEGAQSHLFDSNLLIFAKMMVKWEEEATKVMSHLIFSLDSNGCGVNIVQMASLMQSGQLFRHLGYGDLFDNIPFLEEIVKEYQPYPDVQRDCQFLQNQTELKTVHENLLTVFLICLSFFDGKKSFLLQQFGLKVFKEFEGTNEGDLAILEYYLSEGIRELPVFTEFKTQVSRSKSFSKDIDPGIDRHLFNLKVVDLEKCRQCDWRY